MRHLITLFMAFGMPNEGGIEARLLVLAITGATIEMAHWMVRDSKEKRLAKQQIEQGGVMGSSDVDAVGQNADRVPVGSRRIYVVLAVCVVGLGFFNPGGAGDDISVFAGWLGSNVQAMHEFFGGLFSQGN